MKDRILGRVALEDIRDPFGDEVIVKGNQEIDESLANRIEDIGIEKVRIRSVLTCKSKRGVCALCYGRDLARGRLVNTGESIGIIAAQSIGEPGTQLTMRTFHIGGTASRRAEQTTLESRIDGRVKFINLKTVKNREGNLIVMNRNGEIAILDENDVSGGGTPSFTGQAEGEGRAEGEGGRDPGRMGSLFYSCIDRSFGPGEIR